MKYLSRRINSHEQVAFGKHADNHTGGGGACCCDVFLTYERLSRYSEVKDAIVQEKEGLVQDKALLVRLDKLREQEALLISYAGL